VTLRCKYTVEPERFNPQRLMAGTYVWLFLMPTEPALIPHLPAITCDAQLCVNLANVGGNEVGRRPASRRVIFEFLL
jgi:hypothetical protein